MSNPTEPTGLAKVEAKPEAEPQTTKLEATLLEKATNPIERYQAYQVAEAVRRQQMLAAASKELAGSSWGAKISPAARAAVVRYAFEIGADPLRHLFVLGGNIFINGTYYREVIAANQDFLRADDPVWFHVDPRVTDPEEVAKRAAMRVAHNIPEDCPSACELTIYYRDRGPFKGIGRVRGGTNKNGNPNDPVGMEFPRESAETRAWRECGEKAEASWFRMHPALKAAHEVIAQGRTIADAPEREGLPDDPTAEAARLRAAE
jgi:hypothetical protein